MGGSRRSDGDASSRRESNRFDPPVDTLQGTGSLKVGPAKLDASLEPSLSLVECMKRARESELHRIETTKLASAAASQLLGESARVVKLSTVNGRLLAVVDGAVPMDTLETFYNCVQGDNFTRTEFARRETREFRHHVTEYRPSTMRRTPLYADIERVVRAFFPRQHEPQLNLYRAYTNAVMYGDVAFPHRDSEDNDHVTVIMYPNPEWSSEFGGETMFYDEQGEIVDTVEPKLGRLVLFAGSILHKGSPPGRLFFGARYTAAFKFSPDPPVS